MLQMASKPASTEDVSKVAASVPYSGKRNFANWIDAFVELGAGLEAPRHFYWWAGACTVAGAAQRKITLEAQSHVFYPNLFVILVGPPGTKKSTAIRQGQKLLQQVPGINFTSTAPSVVGLMLDFNDITKAGLTSHQSLNAYISELSTLYENASETMTGFLTAIYDCDDNYVKRTRVGAREHIPAPWFNMIAGTTPAWLGDNVKRREIEGGLTSRTIYVYHPEPIIANPFPEWTKEKQALAQALVHDLAHISTLDGAFAFAGGKTGDAYKWYEDWYMNPARLPRITDIRLSGYFARKPYHLVKLAMNLSLARKDELLLELEDLQRALVELQAIEPGMMQALSAVGGNAQAVELERIGKQIESQGTKGLTYGQLVAANYHQLPQKDLDSVLAYLEAMGKVKRVISPAGATFYPR